MAQPRTSVRPKNGTPVHRLDGSWRAMPEFCRLVAHALRCRRCSIMLVGEDGQLVVEETVGAPPGLVGTARIPLGAGIAGRVAATKTPIVVNEPVRRASLPPPRGEYASDPFLSCPVTLPDGSTGVVNVTEREDGTPFDEDDVALLQHLTAFYAPTYDPLARREVLRLRGELRRLRASVIQAQEAERQRLARELHDDAGHALAAAIFRLDAADQRLIGTGPLTEALAEIRAALTECADHLHDLAFELRPRLLADLGLAPALRSLTRRLREASGLDAELSLHGDPPRRLPDDVELAAFRIAQEATTNALKHAHASRLTLDLTFAEAGVELAIGDDGVGFGPDHRADGTGRGGQGLHGMRERAELIGGMLDVRSRPDGGTFVCAWLPARAGS